MKRITLLLLAMLTFAAAPARAEVEISFDFFHESLSPYGDWCEVDGYGYVWHPAGMEDDWAPYTDGYWTYTDAGWTWVSYEDFGGITYHYGRWIMLDGYGWCWVPDYEWGPAWVSWRRSDDYVGWAPLPPEARWERTTGFGTWVDVSFDIGPGYFRFCRWRDFGAPVIRHVCEPPVRNVTIIHQTVNITNISYRNDYGCVFNGGFDYDYVAPRVAHPVPALKLVRNKTTNIFVNGNKGNVFINSPRGNALVVAAPAVASTNHNVLTKKLDVQRRFQKDRVSRGWSGLEKSGDRERLLVKMREETRGKDAKTAPASAPKQESLAVLPAKPDFDAKPAALKPAPGRRGGTGDAPRTNTNDAPRTAADHRHGGNRDNAGKSRNDQTPGRDMRDRGDQTGGRTAGRDRDDSRGAGKNEYDRPEIPQPAATVPPPLTPPANIPATAGNNNHDTAPGKNRDRDHGAEARQRTAAKEEADAARKEMDKQQRAAEAAAKQQQKDAEREAARQAEAQRNEQARQRMIAERQAEDAKKAARQQAAENTARDNAEKQRRQMEDAIRRAAQQRETERAQAQERARAQAQAQEAQRKQAADNQRRQMEDAIRRAAQAQQEQAARKAQQRAAEAQYQQAREAQHRQAQEAARQQAAAQAANAQRQRAAEQARAAQAEAFRQRQQSTIQPPRPATPPAYAPQNGDGKGKGKNKP